MLFDTAEEFLLLDSDHVVCLFEPTDWVGGQLSSSGVPAVDFAYHKVQNVSTGFVLDVGYWAKQKVLCVYINHLELWTEWELAPDRAHVWNEEMNRERRLE